MFKVDTILAIFVFIVKLLTSTEKRQNDLAESYQASIDKLATAKGEAMQEAARAKAAAEKVSALLA